VNGGLAFVMTKRNEACSTLTILRNRQKADNASINHPAFAAVELTDAVHCRTVNENHHIGILLMVSDSRKSESNGILSACSSTLRDNCAGRKTGMFSSLANSLPHGYLGNGEKAPVQYAIIRSSAASLCKKTSNSQTK